jgi:hypothetical protein
VVVGGSFVGDPRPFRAENSLSLLSRPGRGVFTEMTNTDGVTGRLL